MSNSRCSHLYQEEKKEEDDHFLIHTDKKRIRMRHTPSDNVCSSRGVLFSKAAYISTVCIAGQMFSSSCATRML